MDPSLSNSTPMDPLNMTDSSPCTFHLSSLACCLTSVLSDRLPSCSLLVPALQSSSSPFLSLQTPRGNLSVAISRFISVELHGEESFSTCAKLKCTCTFVSVRSIFIKYSVYGLTYVCRQTDRQTHMSCNAVWGSLRLAPNIQLLCSIGMM